MQIEKHIVSLISGAIIACMLTSCSSEKIEHQFHTDVSINTEYVTLESIKTENTQKFQQMDEYLQAHGLNFKLSILSGDVKEPFDENINETASLNDALLAWVDNPNIELCIYKECDATIGLHGQMEIVMEHMEMFYNALQNLSDDNWTKIKENGNCYPGDEAIILQGRLVQSGNQYYIESSIVYGFANTNR